MTGVLWKSTCVDDETSRELSIQLAIPYKVAKWLRIRGVQTLQQARTWLEVAAPWTEPSAFGDMSKAVHKILDFVSNQQRIVIIGDYDVDGVTSAAILASTLRSLGADFACIIPHRITDGYGLSEKLVDRALEQGANLIVTVDNGIRANESIAYAVAKGLEVIVTDHHEPGDEIPSSASAIVHWCRHSDQEHAKNLSGAGVIWKVCSYLLELSTLSPGELLELEQTNLAFAALGALADMMPVGGENRRLVREGILALKKLNCPGWVALCNIARVDLASLNSDMILWRITPRLNAAGRMDSATIAFELLMTDDGEKAVLLAQKVEECNQMRKTETDRATEEALQQLLSVSDQFANPGAVVVAGPWSLGVVGIVANKLVDQFAVPAIVLSDMGEEILRGSGRAPRGFSLYKALQACSSYLDHFGGHDEAVGCGIQRRALREFRTALCEIAASSSMVESTNGLPGEPIADDYLPLSEATLGTVEWVERFEPFGPDNPQLVFYVGPVAVRRVVPLQGGKHIRLTVVEGSSTADLIWFHAPTDVLSWHPGDICGMTVTLRSNEWQGTKRPQLMIQNGWILNAPLLRNQFSVIYRRLLAKNFLLVKECSALSQQLGIANMDLVMTIFVELGFARLSGSAYHVVEKVTPRDLRDSKAYQRYLYQCHIWTKDEEKTKA